MTKLDTTLNAFQEKITDFAVGKALRNIEAWRKELSEAGPEFADVAGDLEQLEVQLRKDEIDGKAVSKLLTRLSKATRKVAKNVETGDGEKLEQLSAMLERAGKEDLASKQEDEFDQDSSRESGAKAHSKK
jgi:uncharacterized protein YggU (UPF0235/DUF167 family)